jgi:hypothetical protein
MMSRLRLALHVSPSVLVRRGAGLIANYWRARSQRAADARVATYGTDTPAGPLTPLLDRLDVAAFRAHAQFAVPLADLHREGQFDLLGSGWVAVRHGMKCSGSIRPTSPPRNPSGG